MKQLKRAPLIARAVLPNAGVTQWYRRQLVALLARLRATLPLALRRPEGASDDKPVDPVQPTEIGRAINEWQRRALERLEHLPQSLAAGFLKRTREATERGMQSAFKDAGFTVAFEPTPKSLAAYAAVIESQVALIKSVPEQYLKDVQTSVWTAVQKGGDLHTLSSELADRYGVSTRRAALIARTANAQAKGVIENVRRQELGITQARWQHSSAGREPRPSHVAMNGKLFDLAKGMWDPDEGQWILPGQLPNCRCSSSAVIPGFDEGD